MLQGEAALMLGSPAEPDFPASAHQAVFWMVPSFIFWRGFYKIYLHASTPQKNTLWAGVQLAGHSRCPPLLAPALGGGIRAVGAVPPKPPAAAGRFEPR